MTRLIAASLFLLLPAVAALAQDAPPPETVTLEEATPHDDHDHGVPESSVPLAEIQRYVAVFRAVKQAYVDPVGDRELMQGAIRGLLLDLDPHSAYLDSEESSALDEAASGAYDGVGVELVQQPDRTLRVIAPIDDTPAARAGVRAGDVITAIDGRPISADSVDGATTELRGPPGSRVRLTILREGEPGPIELTITRETIRIVSVRARSLEPGYGYVRISAFQADTGRELNRHLYTLNAEAGGMLRGLVIDLRSNPGGLLNAAVEAADAFLEEGVIVSTRGRLQIADSEFHATPGDLLEGAPIVVLIDAGSASAAEVLAGALRDHDRAVVMGSRSFGKGSVQTVLPLDNGDAIKLTTARYYTPSGRSIQAAGIAPDIALHADGDARSVGGIRESDLPNHLVGDEEVADGRYAQGEVLEGDAFIERALEHLRTLVAAREGASAPAAAP
ncbi:S41 family peptidase [Coralloluteibacterium thermophilus]|uniref:S41 family peptidase n=2 Tax=Coralloluteibacterium thermophilum TaxID=2707049 RepID=A0ABV9NK38_9GAMM